MIYTRLHTGINSTVSQDQKGRPTVTLPARRDEPLTVFHTTYTEPVTFTYHREHWDGAVWSIPGVDQDEEYIRAEDTPPALLRALRDDAIFPEYWNIEGPEEHPNHGGSRHWFTSHHVISQDTGAGSYILYDALVYPDDPIIAKGRIFYGEVGFVRPNGEDYWLIADSRGGVRVHNLSIPQEFLRLTSIYDNRV